MTTEKFIHISWICWCSLFVLAAAAGALHEYLDRKRKND